MHNGDVGDFRLVRRRLLASVCDEAFGNVYGSTDSEHFFALFIDSLLDSEDSDPALRMARALARTISRTLELVHEAGSDNASYLNVAIADGDRAVISRFTDDADGVPESLYYFTGELYPVLQAEQRTNAGHPVIVSSERLTADPVGPRCLRGRSSSCAAIERRSSSTHRTGEARAAPIVAGPAPRAASRVSDSRAGRAPRAARGSRR